MYENLVGRLRFKAGVEDFPDSIWDEAADAIEARDKAAEEWEILAESWKKACKRLESRMPRWIPVAERLPDEGIPVLAWEAQGFYYVDRINKGVWEIAEKNCGSVTHWMPGPESPEEGL